MSAPNLQCERCGALYYSAAPTQQVGTRCEKDTGPGGRCHGRIVARPYKSSKARSA
jgi:hypothetical protein